MTPQRDEERQEKHYFKLRGDEQRCCMLIPCSLHGARSGERHHNAYRGRHRDHVVQDPKLAYNRGPVSHGGYFKKLTQIAKPKRACCVTQIKSRVNGQLGSKSTKYCKKSNNQKVSFCG